MDNNDTIDFEISWPRLLRFWLLLISVILSITCSLFTLYHLLFNRTLRHALNNHRIIVLLILILIVQLIDIPRYLDLSDMVLFGLKHQLFILYGGLLILVFFIPMLLFLHGPPLNDTFSCIT